MKPKYSKTKPFVKVAAGIAAFMFLSVSTTLTGQVAVNNDGSQADPAAMLDVKSSTKGLLPPRMSKDSRNAISSPPEGLMIYNTDSKRIEYFNGSKWRHMSFVASTLVTCGNDFIDSRDGKVYGTVQIGNQCWMNENLNVGTMIWDDEESWDNDTTEKYCYDNLEANCDTSGGLYQWDEMMVYITTDSTQGICPTGWHIPSDAEWKTMEMYLGMSQAQADATIWRGTTEGDKLKAVSGWSGGGNGSDSSYFSALPGGHRYTDCCFYDFGTDGYFWTSTGTGSYSGKYRSLRNTQTKVYRNTNYNSGYGYSVRCIKD